MKLRSNNRIVSVIFVLCIGQYVQETQAASAHEVNAQEYVVSKDEKGQAAVRIFYDATTYKEGIVGKAQGGKLQLAMDLNGVMFDQDESIGTQLRLMRELWYKKGTFYTLWAAKQGFSIPFLKKRLQAQGQAIGYCSDAIMHMITEQANDPELLDFLHNAVLEVVTPNIEVASLLRNIKQKGHHVAVLSNMGNGLLKLQMERLKAKIDSGLLNPAELQASQTLHDIASDETCNVVADSVTGKWHKPSHESYQRFLELNTNSQIMTVLVDDKLDNIIGAVENGFVGIFCKKGKAAEALKAALPVLLGENIFHE